MIEQQDSNFTPNNVVVIKPHQNYDVIFDSNLKTTNEIIDFSKDGFYTVLEHSLPNEMIFDGTNRYKINMDGLISKITLNGFPNTGSYILRGCGNNLTTAKYINGELVFDFNKNRSNMLSNIIDVVIGKNEEGVQNRDKYLRTGRLNDLEILATIPLIKNYTITMEGLFYLNNEWKHGIKEYIIYPKEKQLNLEHLVKEMDFYGNDEFKLCLRINDNLYGPFNSKQHDIFKNYIKIKFDGWNDVIVGIQNEYVCENINKKVINCSRLNNISVVSNIDKLCCSNYRYITYDMIYCSRKFV